MSIRSQVALTAVIACLVAGGSSWLVLRFAPIQARTSSEVGESAAAEPGTQEEAPPVTDDQVLEILQPYAWHPDDTKNPNAAEGVYDSEIEEKDSEGLAWLIEKSQAILKSGKGSAEHWFAVGRIALLTEDYVTARDCLLKAAGDGVPAAPAYYADPHITSIPAKQWQLYKQAEVLGFTPAADWKEELKIKAVTKIDERAADPHDPEKPVEVQGVTDANIRAMDAKEIDELIEDYTFLTAESDIPHRVAFELGRLAFLHNRRETAVQLLTLAAEKGSGAAHALLAYDAIAPERQIEHLEKAVERKYTPAQRRLDDLKAIMNLPKPTR